MKHVDIVNKYLELCGQIKIIERQREELKDKLIELIDEELKIKHIENYELKLIIVNGEAFKLKDAKEVISLDVLRPFITPFTSKRLNIKKIA